MSTTFSLVLICVMVYLVSLGVYVYHTPTGTEHLSKPVRWATSPLELSLLFLMLLAGAVLGKRKP